MCSVNFHMSYFHMFCFLAKTGGVQTGGFPDLDLSFLFCPFWDFPDFSEIFPICSGMVWGFSRLVLFLFLGLLRAPTRNSPERVRDTIWTFPEKVGNTRVWKPPGLASLNERDAAPVSRAIDSPLLGCRFPLTALLSPCGGHFNLGEACYLQLKLFLLTVKLLCLQSLKALIR